MAFHRLSADGGKLVATVAGGSIWTSTDSGNTWVSHATTTNRNWLGSASAADGPSSPPSSMVAKSDLSGFRRSLDGKINQSVMVGHRLFL